MNNSMRANHQDTTQLTEVLYKAKTDDTFLMQLGAYCIGLANSETTTVDISTSADGINDGAYSATSASSTADTSLTTDTHTSHVYPDTMPKLNVKYISKYRQEHPVLPEICSKMAVFRETIVPCDETKYYVQN